MADDVLHDRSTIALLEKLGLSRNEVGCYLASLLLGPASVRDIAARASVHRVNAYAAVRNLVEHGLVRQEVRGGVRTVVSEPLHRLDAFAQEHQKRSTRLRWKVADLVPTLAAMSAKETGTPLEELGEVLFFRGDDAFYRVADRTLQAPEGSTICFLEFSNYFHPTDNPGYDDEYYIPRRVARKLSARVLYRRLDHYAERLSSTDAHELRETRFLPPDVIFPCSIYLYDEEVAFIWTTTQTFGLIIKRSPIVGVMRLLFEMLWEGAERPTVAGGHASCASRT